MKKQIIGLFNAIIICLVCSSCATNAKIVGNFNPSPTTIDEDQYDEVIVTGFNYSSMRQTSRYTGSSSANGYVTNYYEVLKEYSGGEISKQIADMLKRNGVNARALKDYNVDKLEPGQILLTGNVELYNYGSFQAWQVIPFFLLIGNVLPAPWGFSVGAIVNYDSEIINSEGEILYQVPRKSATASYKHWWVWGAMASSKKNYEKASDILGPEAFDEILSVFGKREQ